MTAETHLVFALDDVRQIRLTCQNPKCGAIYSFRAVGTPRIPARCPNCDSQWFGVPSAEEEHLAEFVRLLGELARRRPLGCLDPTGVRRA